MDKRVRIAGFAAHLTCLLFALGGLAETGETTGYGTGDNRAQALIDAKVDAILNFGGTVSAERVARHDELVRDEEKSENNAYLISYEVIDQGESIEGSYVRIKAKVSNNADYALKDGNANVCGEGKGKTEDEAMVMAMCDAILESGAKVRVAVKTENAQLAEHSARMEARGAIVSCEREKKDAPGNAVAAYCRIVPDARSLNRYFPKNVSGTGTGENVVAAIRNARRDMLLESGSEFIVNALYKYGVLQSIRAERRCDAFISTIASLRSKGTESKAIEAHTRGMRYNGEDELYPHIRKGVEGHGFGKDFSSARKAALCDAFVNRGSHATLQIRYNMGRKIEETAQFHSSFNYFGEKITSQSKTRDGYVVAMEVSAGGDLPELDESLSQSVEAVGYAKDRWYLPAFIETFLAKMDAWQGAVDMVFGCPVDVSVSERNGAVNNRSCSYKHSLGSMIIKYYTQMGYVGKSQVVSQKSDNGVVAVRVAAVVKKHSMSLLSTIVYSLIAMVGGFTVIKKKLPFGNLLLAVAWIFSALSFFAFEHWVLGIVAIVIGIRCHFMEADY